MTGSGPVSVVEIERAGAGRVDERRAAGVDRVPENQIAASPTPHVASATSRTATAFGV